MAGRNQEDELDRIYFDFSIAIIAAHKLFYAYLSIL